MRLEKSWAISVAVFCILSCFYISESLMNDGLGIVGRDGEFVMQQGRAVRHIDQLLGLAVYAAKTSLLFVMLIVGLLTAFVAARHTSLDLGQVFPANSDVSPHYASLVRGSMFLVLIPCLIGVVKCLLWFWARA